MEGDGWMERYGCQPLPIPASGWYVLTVMGQQYVTVRAHCAEIL